MDLELEVKLMHVLCGMYFEELDRDADEETIKTAYRKLAKFYHPDGWFVLLLLCSWYLVILFTAFQALYTACNSNAPVNMTKRL
uniref:J domain-containing protein n=1 Tax=Arundo donax TaxID=35708 RepID=A0A0A9G0Z8_ARUDO